MDLAGPSLAHDLRVRRRDVADVRREAVARIHRVRGAHVAVARHLGDDRGGGDRGALRVAVDDRPMLRCGRAQLEAVDQRDVGGLTGPERRPQPLQVAAVQPVAVDHRGRVDVDRDSLGARENRVVQLVAHCFADLLRVVQERERADAVVAQAVVVEQHARDDERPGERPAAGLVRTRDQPAAEVAVVAEQPLSGALLLRRHGPRIARAAAASRRRFALVAEKSQGLHTVDLPPAQRDEPAPVLAAARRARRSPPQSGGRGR